MSQCVHVTVCIAKYININIATALQMKGPMKEPNMFHNYETEKIITHKAFNVIL